MVILIVVAFAGVFIALVASLVFLYSVEENRMKSFNKEVWTELSAEATSTENIFKEVVVAKKNMNSGVNSLPVSESHHKPVGKAWNSSIPEPLENVV